MGGHCCLCQQPAQPRKKYVCAACFKLAASSRQGDVQALTRERDAGLEQLEEALAAMEEQRRRDLQLLHLAEGLRESQQRVSELEARLLAIQQRTAELRQQTLERGVRLRDAKQQLGRHMHKTHQECAQQAAALSTNYLRTLDIVSREQRTRVVRRLMDILPLKLVPPATSGGRARAGQRASPTPGAEEERAVVMVCGLLLPDARDDIGELVQLLPQLGSSLGCVALLLDVLSRFLQLPLLHRAHFCGSHTRLWQPDSFWDMRSTPPPGALPLFPPKQPPDGHGHNLYSAVAGMAGAGGAGASAAEAAAGVAALQRALYALQRSAGAVVFARLGPDAPLRVPPDWSPFAWLGGLCKMLAAEPRPLSASRVMVPGHGHGAHSIHQHHPQSRLAASVVFGRLSPEQDPLGQSMLWPDEEGDEEWDIIPRPSYGRMIPPPPSQPDDVEHWTQAMYPGAAAAGAGAQGQGQAAQQAGQQAAAGAAAAAAAAVAVSSSPVERVRQAGALMWKYVGGGGSG